MKKMFFALMVMLTSTLSASAMSYEQARNEALFLTDKMAYELNLTDEQYEAAYEINLDYLMGVAGRDDVFQYSFHLMRKIFHRRCFGYKYFRCRNC